MPKRLAGCCALVVFAFCLVLGMRADNTFSTTVTRALVAMAGTFGVGLVIGFAAQRMLDENMRPEEERHQQQLQQLQQQQQQKSLSQGAVNDR